MGYQKTGDMVILVAKVNEEFIRTHYKKAVFTSSTLNTSTFTLSTKAFDKLKSALVKAGENPYSLMSW